MFPGCQKNFSIMASAELDQMFKKVPFCVESMLDFDNIIEILKQMPSLISS
jgi:hypothetical protein